MGDINLGSLGPILKRSAGRDFGRSSGPVSDAYIVSTDPFAAIMGPQGSGKTVASVKKVILEATRIWPGPDGVRRYTIGVVRQKYLNLWATTIPSWLRILPKDLPGAEFTGSSPRPATHVIPFEDGFGPIIITAQFKAFGEAADPEDEKGWEYTDVYLNEIDTLPEAFVEMLPGRVGRDPPREIIRRSGRIFGDLNAPDVLSWAYRDFIEEPKDGYRFFRQPGGLTADAENLQAVGREYYLNQMRLNAHRPWWIKRMIHNQPGFTRDLTLVYTDYDDERHVSPYPLEVFKEIPVLIGIDGGLTPAAVFCQDAADGQFRVLDEIALTHNSEQDLAAAINALIARRFQGCEFVVRCDPAMGAGEDTTDGSARYRLEKALGIPVKLAKTNVTDARWEAVRRPLARNLSGGRPGFIMDARCKGLRRGFNQTYHYRTKRGSNELTTVDDTMDTHPHDGLQYAALEAGTAVARKRKTDLERERKARREASKASAQRRYSPLGRGGRR